MKRYINTPAFPSFHFILTLTKTMDSNLPLNQCHTLTTNLIINRLHMLFNTIAIAALFYYRSITLLSIINNNNKSTPLIPYLIVCISELFLTSLWVLHQAYRWRPVKRSVHPDRLPGDDKLPEIDVFVCTADPSKEPSIGVMNTVISAMSLDYPPDKLSVYLSDDGGSWVTLEAMRESWKFARFWIPFCKKYGLKNRCPEAFFIVDEEVNANLNRGEFEGDKKELQRKYKEFQDVLEKNSVNAKSSVSRNHAPTVEVINDKSAEGASRSEMPLLVYCSREKRPGHPHHFKGGALNTLLRVSGVISNAPYFLVLDCDMYCGDPTSARQAMCFYLDPKISPKISWVQYPQKFRNSSAYDIYDGRLHPIWREGQGLDGLRGPTIYGCNFFMTRESIYGKDKIRKGLDVGQLKKSFGVSNEFIKTVFGDYKPNVWKDGGEVSESLQKEIQLLASCTYCDDSEWGLEVGYRYFTVVEDSMTSLILHCKGWISVFIDPAKPCFLGACTSSLNDMLVQQTRWSFGLMQIGLSKFSPILYGPPRMSILQSMCYTALVFDALYVVPFYGLALIPSMCLVNGISLYPKVSDPYFIVFAYIFFASLLKHVQEVYSYGDSFMTSLYELRVWMMKSGVCYFYATMNAILDKLGMMEANFSLTNKDIEDEQVQRHLDGIYDFQASLMLLVPLCSLYIINVASFLIGTWKIIQTGNDLFMQASLSLFGIVLNYYLLEGMILRKDKGRVSLLVCLLSAAISAAFLFLGPFILMH